MICSLSGWDGFLLGRKLGSRFRLCQEKIKENLTDEVGGNSENDVAKKENGGRRKNRKFIGYFNRILKNSPDKRQGTSYIAVDQIRLSMADNIFPMIEPGTDQRNDYKRK